MRPTRSWKPCIHTNAAGVTVVALTTADAVQVAVTVAATDTIENGKLKMENWDNQVLIFHFLCSPKVQSILIFEY